MASTIRISLRPNAFGKLWVLFLFCSFALRLSAQTIIFNNPGATYTNTDMVTNNTYNVGIGNCTSISISMNFNFSVGWLGAGNLESNDECGACPGDPTMADVGPCANCWDFLYVRYQIDGVTVLTRLVGVLPDLAQSGTISFGPICTAGASTATIIVETQTWAANESITFSNITVTCWDASSTPMANPNPACEGQTVNLSATLTNPSSVGGQQWSGPGSIANPNALNTTVTGLPVGSHTFTLTTTDDNNCTKTSTTTVDVNPPVVADNPGPQVFCAGDAIPGIPLTGTASSYNWTNSNVNIGLGASGSGDIPGFTAPNVTTTTNATITVTPISPGCNGTAITFPITINPAPVANQPSSLSLCGGGPNSTVNLSGAGGAILNWSNDNTATGVPASGTGTFNFSPANVSSTEVSNITITPVNAAGCPGTPVNFTITVNPGPSVTNPGPQVFCAGEAVPSIGLSGTAASYSWTNSNTGIGLAAGGTGDLPGFTAANVSSPTTGTINVSASSPGCASVSAAFPITINPAPTANQPAALSLCAGGPASSVTLSGSVGATLNWTNNNTATGIPANGTGTFTFSPANVSTTEISTITITPSNAFGCPGTPVTFNITVNPGPTINNPGPQVFCAGQPVPSILLTGTGSSYSWMNANTAIGLGANGTGNLPAFTAANVSAPTTATISISANAPGCSAATANFPITINPTPSVTTPPNQSFCGGQAAVTITLSGSPGAILNWTNNSTATGIPANGTGSFTFSPAVVASPQVSTITITPSNASGCPGTPVIFVLVVNATPIVNNPGAQTFCAGASVPQLPFSGQASDYNWTNSNTAIGLAASGTGFLPAFTAANVSSVTTASITVTPTNPACVGTPVSFPITINPAPTATQPANQSFCGGEPATTITLSGATGTTLNWTNNNTATGIPANGTGTFSFSPANVATTQVSTITLTPANASGCPGTPLNFTVTVNPTPTATNPGAQTYCAGASVPALTLVGTATTYNWTNSNPAIGLGASGTGNIPAFTAANVASATTANITVTPSSPGCSGTAITFPITINPAPTATQPANQSFCGGEPATTITLSGSPGATLNWSNNNVSTGIPANGTGTFSFSPPNVATTQVSTITITPANASGCPGTPLNFTVTVNPTPTATNPGAQTYCAGASVPALTLAGTATTYNWTNSNPAIGLAASGTGNIPAFTAANVASATTANITVTPSSPGCSGTAIMFPITINPAPTATQPANQSFCGGEPATTITLSGSPGTTLNWSNNNISTGIPANGTGTFSFSPPNVNNAQVSTITITPANASGCPGTPLNFTVTVNPTPTAINPGAQTYCAGASVPVIALQGTGTSYSWTNSNTGIGLGAGGSANIPAFTAANVSSVTTANISVTPATQTCTGTAISFPITINPSASATQPMNVVLCSGTGSNTVSLSGSSGTNFSWSNNNTATGVPANGTGSIVFSPANVSATQVSNISVVANNAFNCPAAPLNFTVTVNPLPVINITTVACAPSLTNYSVTLNSNAPITASAGTISGTLPNFVISQIPAGTNLSITALNASTACSTSQSVNAPNCNCAPVTAAGNPNNPAICAGAPLPALSASAGPGLVLDWYASPTGGTALASNSPTFTPPAGAYPPGTYTFYVETREPGSNCVSATRTAVTLTVNPVPAVNAMPDQALCAGASLNLNFSGTTGAAFNWVNSNPAIGLPASGSGNAVWSPAANLSTNQTADIAVTPELGTCSGPTLHFTLSAQALPLFSGVNTQCAPDLLSYTVNFSATQTSAALLSASNGVLSGTAPNFSLSQIPAGINVSITATGTGSAACSSTLDVSAPNCNCPPVAPPSNPSNPSICEGAPLPALGVSAGAGLVVDWYDSPSGGTPLATIALNFAPPPGAYPPGSYTFYAETRDVATGCTSPSRIPVVLTVKAKPTADAIPDQSACAGESLNLSFSGTNNPAFAWTNSNTAIGLGASGNGSSISVQVPANLPAAQTANISVTPSANGCSGAPVAFKIKANPQYNIVISKKTCNPALVGSSVQNLQTQFTLCDSIITTNTVLDPQQGLSLDLNATLYAGGFGVHCAGASDGTITAVTTGGSSPYTYQWSTSQTTAQISNLSAGSYSLSVLDANGCGGSAQIELTEPPALQLGLSALPPHCGDLTQSVQLNPDGGAAPYSVTLNGSPVSGLNLKLPAGAQSIVLQDANGCSADSTLLVELHPAVLLSLPQDTLVRLGEILDITAQTNLSHWQSVTWTPQPDPTRNNSLQQVWLPTNPATYTVKIVDSLGCSASASMLVYVKSGNIYVPNVFSPASQEGNSNWLIYADASVELLETVHIFDRWGDEVYTQENPIPLAVWSGWDGRARGKDAAPAVYVYYAKLKLVNGEKVVLKGDVTLLR